MRAGRPVWVKRDVVPLYIFHTGKTRPSLRHISSEGMVFLWGPVLSRFFWLVYGQVCSRGPCLDHKAKVFREDLGIRTLLGFRSGEGLEEGLRVLPRFRDHEHRVPVPDHDCSFIDSKNPVIFLRPL